MLQNPPKHTRLQSSETFSSYGWSFRRTRWFDGYFRQDDFAVAGPLGEGAKGRPIALGHLGAETGLIERLQAFRLPDEGRAAALAACPQPDILVTNAGGPPPGDFRRFSREEWLKA